MLTSTLFPLRSSLQSGSRQAPHSPPCGDGQLQRKLSEDKFNKMHKLKLSGTFLYAFCTLGWYPCADDQFKHFPSFKDSQESLFSYNFSYVHKPARLSANEKCPHFKVFILI